MKYLSDYTSDKQTAIFNEFGAFFAFSDKQFNEAKKEDVEYVSLGFGFIVPEVNAKEITEKLEIVQKEAIAQDIADNGKYRIIRRELFNHECFYAGDIMDCVDKLEEYNYSYDDIYQVYSHVCNTEDVD